MDHKVDRSARGARSDARILRSKAALRNALLTLLETEEFGDLTVADIVSKASVGYATFFRHYADKNTLLAEIADSLVADLTEHMAPLVINGEAEGAAAVLVDRVRTDGRLFRALILGAGEPFRRTMTDRAIQMSLALPMEINLGNLPRELVVRHAVSATLTVLSWWLETHRDLPPETLRVILRQLVIDPIASSIDFM